MRSRNTQWSSLSLNSKELIGGLYQRWFCLRDHLPSFIIFHNFRLEYCVYLYSRIVVSDHSPSKLFTGLSSTLQVAMHLRNGLVRRRTLVVAFRLDEIGTRYWLGRRFLHTGALSPCVALHCTLNPSPRNEQAGKTRVQKPLTSFSNVFSMRSAA